MPTLPRVLAFAGVLALGGLALVLAGRPSSAEEPQRPKSIVYLNVSGDGSTAKAWYRGAPPTGQLVQEALDYFAREGYRVHSVTSGHRPSLQSVTTASPATPQQLILESQYLILLEKW